MRKSALDRAINELEQRRIDLRKKYDADLAGLDAAIEALRHQRPRQRKPKAVEMPPGKSA